MAMFGIAEVLMILLLGSSLPADVEPLSADQLLNGMPDQCELLLVQDVRGSYEALNGLLEQLSTQSWVMGNRELVEGINEARGAMTAMPAEMASSLGFNPFTDITSMGLCGRLATSPSGEPAPSFLVVVQGSFPTTAASSIAGQMGMSQNTLSNGATIYGEREDGVLFGMISPTEGLLLFGTEDLLVDRSGGGALPQAWQSAPADSLVGRVAALAPGGPRTVAGFAPSAGTRFLIGGEAPVSFGQLIAGVEYIALLTNGTTTYIESVATNADGRRDQELILSGIGAYMEGAPFAMRALSHVFLGVLSPDDPELDDELRAMLRGRDEILSFLDDLGAFEASTVTFNSDASSLTTTLQIESPGGLTSIGTLMGMGMGMFVLGARSAEPAYYDDYPAYEEAYEEPATEGSAPPR